MNTGRCSVIGSGLWSYFQSNIMRLKRCNAVALGHRGGYLYVITVNIHSNKTVSAEFFSFLHQETEPKEILCLILNMCILVLAHFATKSFGRNHQHPSERKTKPQTHPLKSNEDEWRFKIFHFQTSRMFSYEFYLFRINLKKVIIQNALHLKK